MQDLKKKLAYIEKPYRNEVRWWLSEGHHTDQTLINEVKMLDEAGFGAAEFLAMGDYGVDVSRYGWGSEEFVHDTHLILEQTTLRGMGASMTSGTNWSNANLNNITPDDKAAAKELAFVTEEVPAGGRYSRQIPRPKITQANVHEQTLIAVVAMKNLGPAADGKRTLLPTDGVVLTGEVKDGFLNWKAPEDGDYLLFSVWMQGTGQTASPSCSVNYTINYIDKYGTQALIDYWNREVLTPSMRETLLKNGRVQLYMDSLELSTYANGGQLWGYDFMDEFKARRGYDLTPHLPLVFKQKSMMMTAATPYLYVCQDETFFKKLINDLYQTMTDMYMENVLSPIQTWLHGVGMTLRAEISYGLPFEISQPGKFVDGIETESLEFASQIDSYRGMAGAAHIYHRLFSSETGAMLANYKKNLDFYTQIIFTQFAAGVARTVLHGYSSICGPDTPAHVWPGREGMLPIFSERFGSRQPAYRHYNDWNNMVGRYQYLLRQGKPRMDLGILRLDYTYNNMVMAGGTEEDLYEHKFMRANEGLYWKNTDLQNAGYTYDYFAPQLLKDTDCDGTLCPDGPGYQAILVYQEMLDADSAAKLLEYAKQGLKVLFVNDVTETIALFMNVTHHKAASLTPFNDGREAELEKILFEMKALPNVREISGPENALPALREMGVEPRIRFAAPNRNVLPFMREDGDTRYAYLYNCMFNEKAPVTFQVELLGQGVPYAVDCWTGDVKKVGAYQHKGGRTIFTVTLNPGQATIFALDMGEKIGHVIASNASLVREKNGKTCLAARTTGDYSARLTSGQEIHAHIEAPADIDLPLWKLQVESWDAGDKVEITEDRGLGYVTREIYYDTNKTMLDAGEVKLKPWKDIPAVGPEVSGVGFYSAEFELPETWNSQNMAVFQMDSVCGSTAAVYVNGVKAPAVDFARPEVDITALVKPGKNEIKVEVTSTLANRLQARGYFRDIPKMMGIIMSDPTVFGEMPGSDDEKPEDAPEGPGFPMTFETEPVNYGLTGGARITTYTLKEI